MTTCIRKTVTRKVELPCVCEVCVTQEICNTYQFWRSAKQNGDSFRPAFIYNFIFFGMQNTLKIMKGNVQSLTRCLWSINEMITHSWSMLLDEWKMHKNVCTFIFNVINVWYMDRTKVITEYGNGKQFLFLDSISSSLQTILAGAFAS